MNDQLAIRLVPLLIIGICDQLITRSITIREAEVLLFSPHAMEYFGRFSKELKRLIHIGTELDDINQLLPATLPDAIKNLRLEAERFLELNSTESLDTEGHWFEIQE